MTRLYIRRAVKMARSEEARLRLERERTEAWCGLLMSARKLTYALYPEKVVVAVREIKFYHNRLESLGITLSEDLNEKTPA